MFRTIWSYFLPVKLKEYASQNSGTVEINLVNGQKVLDTRTSNYSYGSLQKILHTGLIAAGFDKNVRSVLVLGMGGGSVVPTIREKFQSDAHITLVEIDEKIIEIARNEFNIERFGKLEIVHADALDFVAKKSVFYDVIIIDLFIVNTIPEVFTQSDFLKNIAQKLNPRGKLIYNTMAETLSESTLGYIQHELSRNGLRVSVLRNVNFSNHLLIGTKGE